MKVKLRYASVAVVLLAVMLGLIIVRIYTQQAGHAIRLRTNVMDVQKLISGEQVEFDFGIARINLTTLPGDDQFELGDTVYVSLGRLPNGEWVAQSTHSAPPLEGHEVVLKGEVMERQYLDNIPPPVRITREIRVRYGIERYGVPRGTFEPLPQFSNPMQKVTVDAAVNALGRAAITRVRVGNEVYNEPML